ncbi:MAG TPA: dTMP kinase [Vampirovibrionales bacterium]
MGGLFITIEGADGAGKTTQIELLQKLNNPQFLLTRNPGGTKFGLKLREILLNDKSVQVSEMAELFLYMADRAQHIKDVIEPALKKNLIIICDRFADSTLAYQGYGRGLSLELINDLNKIATSNLEPDLTFYLDVSPEVGLARAKEQNKMEAEGLKFQQKVRNGFLELAKKNPERFITIDTSQNNINEVHQIILSEIENANKKINSLI